MNRIVLAFVAVLALFALPSASNATVCGRAHGCAKAHHHHHHHVRAKRVVVAAAPVVREDRGARWAKFRAERAASGAAFRASLKSLFARAPRPAPAPVVRTERAPCTLFSRVRAAAPAPAPVAAPARRPCTLFQRAARVEAAPRATRIAGCARR